MVHTWCKNGTTFQHNNQRIFNFHIQCTLGQTPERTGFDYR